MDYPIYEVYHFGKNYMRCRNNCSSFFPPHTWPNPGPNFVGSATLPYSGGNLASLVARGTSFSRPSNTIVGTRVTALAFVTLCFYNGKTKSNQIHCFSVVFTQECRSVGSLRASRVAYRRICRTSVRDTLVLHEWLEEITGV